MSWSPSPPKLPAPSLVFLPISLSLLCMCVCLWVGPTTGSCLWLNAAAAISHPHHLIRKPLHKALAEAPSFFCFFLKHYCSNNLPLRKSTFRLEFICYLPFEPQILSSLRHNNDKLFHFFFFKFVFKLNRWWHSGDLKILRQITFPNIIIWAVTIYFQEQGSYIMSALHTVHSKTGSVNS